MSTQTETIATQDTTEYGQKYVLLWWRSAVRDHFAVVASVNIFDAHHGDWAAYLGGCPTQDHSDIESVARFGAKLSETEARAFARGRFGLENVSYRA